MRKTICFFAALFIINIASAQSYYGYCTAQSGSQAYVSEVVDVTTLPNSNVPTRAPYGKIKLADYYDQVIKQWYYGILSKNGVDPKNCFVYPQLTAGTEELSNTCKTGYEPACLCQNKNAAIEQRNKFLDANSRVNVFK